MCCHSSSAQSWLARGAERQLTSSRSAQADRKCSMSACLGSTSPSSRSIICSNTTFGIRAVTLRSLDDMSALQAAHPQMRFVQYDGITMPFADHEFDWIYCNAVIEHVGGEAAQERFLSEMLRVSKHVFFTTPNRFFPIEVHSSKILLHWHRAAFDNWARRTGRLWLDSEHLRLLSERDLRALLKKTRVREYEIRQNRFLGLTMTFSVVAHS